MEESKNNERGLPPRIPGAGLPSPFVVPKKDSASPPLPPPPAKLATPPAPSVENSLPPLPPPPAASPFKLPPPPSKPPVITSPAPANHPSAANAAIGIGLASPDKLLAAATGAVPVVSTEEAPAMPPQPPAAGNGKRSLFDLIPEASAISEDSAGGVPGQDSDYRAESGLGDVFEQVMDKPVGGSESEPEGVLEGAKKGRKFREPKPEKEKKQKEPKPPREKKVREPKTPKEKKTREPKNPKPMIEGSARKQMIMVGAAALIVPPLGIFLGHSTLKRMEKDNPEKGGVFLATAAAYITTIFWVFILAFLATGGSEGAKPADGQKEPAVVELNTEHINEFCEIMVNSDTSAGYSNAFIEDDINYLIEYAPSEDLKKLFEAVKANGVFDGTADEDAVLAASGVDISVIEDHVERSCYS